MCAFEIAQADQIWVSPSSNYTQALFERNRYMVDQSQVLIAIWDEVHKGGTAYTVQQAQKSRKTSDSHSSLDHKERGC